MSTTKPIVYCDLDSVVIDMLPGWVARYNAGYNDSLQVSQITDWDMVKFVKPECGRAIYDYLHVHELYDDAPPIEGALEGIKELRKLGYRVVFATACNKFMAGRKLQWLADHGFLELVYGTFSYDYVELQDKSLLSGSGVAIIDDYPKNLAGFTRGELKILFPAHHNLHLPHDATIYRPTGWQQVVELLAIHTIRHQATLNTSVQPIW
jgi:5'-nucleotidase